MIEVVGDLWDYPADWRCITTNGFVKKNGECVMGRGCAYEATQRYHGLAKRLGQDILQDGNYLRVYRDLELIAFPVKHHWYEKADPELIQRSAQELGVFVKDILDEYDYILGIDDAPPTFLLPRPGCGNGGLKWEEVKPLLIDLPDNVKVITR